MLESLTSFMDNDKVANAYKSMYKKQTVNESSKSDYEKKIDNIINGLFGAGATLAEIKKELEDIKNIKPRDKTALLAIAVGYEHMSAVKYFVEELKWDVNGKYNDNDKERKNYSPLARAVEHGDTKLIKYLIANGAKVDILCDDAIKNMLELEQDTALATVKLLIGI